MALTAERIFVDDNMIRAAIERGDAALAQAYIQYMQLDVLRAIRTRIDLVVD